MQVRQSVLEEISTLELDVAPKLKRIEELKSQVKQLLIRKATVEFGRYDVFVIKRPHRNVPWGRVVIEYLGQKFFDEYKKRFPVYIHFDIKVEEHAVLPLWKSASDGAQDGQSPR